MVNWVKGAAEGPHQLLVEEEVYDLPRIPTHLQLQEDLSRAAVLDVNSAGTTMGVIFGHEGFRSVDTGFPSADQCPRDIRRPVATGGDLLRSQLEVSPEHCLYLCGYSSELEAKRSAPAAYAYLRSTVFPLVSNRAASGKETEHYARWLKAWWKPHWAREEFFTTLAGERMIVCSNPQARPIFAFLSTKFVPTNTLQVFAYDDDYSFGVLQSSAHWAWTRAKGGKVTERIRYTNEVWTTFPWPQEPREEEVVAVAAAARRLREVRATLMRDNGWSLRTLYQAAEVVGPHPLKDAQAALDEALRAAYGMPTGQDATEFLLELNGLVAEDEREGRKVQGPGLPLGLSRLDPRLTSKDCIEPPGS
jgi:hypothetical protein